MKQYYVLIMEKDYEVRNIFLIWFSILYIFGLFVTFAIIQWRAKYDSRGAWLVSTLILIPILTIIIVIGRWDLNGYWFRIVFPVVFLFIMLRSYLQIKHLPWNLSKVPKLSLVFVVLLVGTLPFIFSGYVYQPQAIDLKSPLRDGYYDVVHGGASTLINYHHSHPKQAYALDIVKLNRFGWRASGVAPTSLAKYEIYGDTIYSPCNGKIIEMVDGLKELAPNEMNKQTQPYRKKNPTGNSVIIQCGDTQVHIAHMIPGSIKVKKGELVTTAAKIGKVGNSGNTSEPHLHIHAEKNGKGVPILFDGKFLKRNSIF